MSIYYADDSATVWHGDCLDVLPELEPSSVDAVVTDPPYSLTFMGREWDRHDSPAAFQSWCEKWARECLRVLKPGGHLLAFGGTRTYHRLTCGIEDAGFEIRDSIVWLYGSGFPKSLDVGKAIDRAAGAEREVIGANASHRPRSAETVKVFDGGSGGRGVTGSPHVTAPATDAARQWHGWGTALKPAAESVVVARRPLVGTVAANVQAWGTGALNIASCRVAATDKAKFPVGYNKGMGRDSYAQDEYTRAMTRTPDSDPSGRWPANVVLSHAATPDGGDGCADGCVQGCPVAELDGQSGDRPSGGSEHERSTERRAVFGQYTPGRNAMREPDSGGASRYFPTFRYQAKAPTDERPKVDGVAHPTVKPGELMRWLVRLVTPPGGLVLDPFAGTGTTAEACIVEGFRCVAIERDPTSLPLIRARLRKPMQPVLGLFDDGEAS